LSEIRATTISDAAGTGPIALTKQSAAKAYASVDQLSGGAALLKSFNVTSVTDNATGDFSLSFTSNFSDGNYVTSGLSGDKDYGFNYRAIAAFAPTVSSARYGVSVTNTLALVDDYGYASIHGDLA
jgi:hypothetical protein